jgi:lipopolysaccharide biosynthesis glycosyltransferase
MIHVVCCSDENYAFNFPVIAESILEHHTNEEVAFHFVHSALTSVTQDKIESYVAEKGINFSHLLINDSVFSHLPQIGYFTIGMYYRLLIPELMRADLQKVLYLDMDVIVEGRLDELWNQDLTNKGAAVIEDGEPKHLGEFSPKNYFNSGVMLINLDFWRSHKVKEQAIDFMVNHRDILRFPDQDALNVVLGNHIVLVPTKWNYHLNLDKKFLRQALRGKIGPDKAPVIVHFNQKIKPWMYHCKHPYTARYWQILKRTTFKNYKMKNKTVGNFLFYWTPKPLRSIVWRKRLQMLPQN